jgi:hypothetical protein
LRHHLPDSFPHSLQATSSGATDHCPICVCPMSCSGRLYAAECGYLCHLECMQRVSSKDTPSKSPTFLCPICFSRHLRPKTLQSKAIPPACRADSNPSKGSYRQPAPNIPAPSGGSFVFATSHGHRWPLSAVEEHRGSLSDSPCFTSRSYHSYYSSDPTSSSFEATQALFPRTALSELPARATVDTPPEKQHADCPPAAPKSKPHFPPRRSLQSARSEPRSFYSNLPPSLSHEASRPLSPPPALGTDLLTRAPVSEVPRKQPLVASDEALPKPKNPPKRSLQRTQSEPASFFDDIHSCLSNPSSASLGLEKVNRQALDQGKGRPPAAVTSSSKVPDHRQALSAQPSAMESSRRVAQSNRSSVCEQLVHWGRLSSGNWKAMGNDSGQAPAKVASTAHKSPYGHNGRASYPTQMGDPNSNDRGEQSESVRDPDARKMADKTAAELVSERLSEFYRITGKQSGRSDRARPIRGSVGGAAPQRLQRTKSM